jgi:3'-5' exoribonuclease
LPSAGALVQVALGAAGLAAAQRGTDPVPVQRLWSLPRVQPGVNLLHTVPVHWLPSEPLQGLDVSHAFALLWARLPEALRAWFNAIFWEHPQRLWAFLHAPASLAHHHAGRHGLLRHSLECALHAVRLSRSDPEADPGVLLLAALLHDVGKAGEYEAWLSPRAHADPRGPQRAGLSLRGELLGHRLTGLEWMAQARAWLPATLAPSETQALAVYHAIHACHAPAWVGLRSPRTPEAHYLASVDALSGHLELMGRLWRQGHAQGVRHPALQGRQYWPRHTLA